VAFTDAAFTQVIVDYSKEQEELKVFVGNTSSPVIKMQLKLTEFVSMDNGSAFLGFTHETTN
jgi:hypothetical protein